MNDHRDLYSPSSPEGRRQAELRRAFEEKERETAERAAQISVEHGTELQYQAELRGVDEPKVRRDAADLMAARLAERGARPGNIDWRDHRGVADEAVEKAIAADEAKRRQEFDNTKSLKTDWHKTAHEVLDRRLPPAQNEGTSRPTPQPPSLNQQLQLTANEVLQRFNDPALQARYLERERRYDQEKKSSQPMAGTSSSAQARGNAPTEKAQETDLRSYFRTSEIKKKAAEEAEQRSNDLTKGPGRSGGRGR